jgi:glycosyltransferase involved in cell wall biosynthesis
MQPLVSVIIPVYNAEKYITETIRSVLSQTYINYELIVVNDGSTDGSAGIIESLIKNGLPILLLNKSNTGVSDSRNFGLKNAKGTYVAFLDADDLWLPNNLDIKIKSIEQQGTDAVCSFCEIIDENSQRTGVIKRTSAAVTLEDVLLWKANYITIPSGFLYSAETIRSLGGFTKELSNNADQELLMRLLASNKKITWLQEVTWLYRQHLKNMSSNIRLMESDTLKTYAAASARNYFKSIIFKNKCYSKMYLVLAGSWWKNGKNRSRGLYFLMKAFLSSPSFALKEFFAG